jgi:hypothetical protein
VVSTFIPVTQHGGGVSQTKADADVTHVQQHREAAKVARQRKLSTHRHVEEAYLFGSYAKGEADIGSLGE